MAILVVLATVVGVANALAPNFTLSWGVRVTSPLFSRDPADSWIDTYANSDDSLYTTGVRGAGIPTLVGGPGGRVSFAYVGRNMTWYAYFNGSDPGQVTIDLDGNAQPSPRNTFQDGDYQRLVGPSNVDVAEGSHTSSIGLGNGAPADARLLVEGATFGLPIVAPTLDRKDIECWRWPFAGMIAPGTSNQFIKTTGPWRISHSIGGIGGQPVIPYPTIWANESASVQVTLPASSTMLEINGTVGPGYGRYTVEVNPPPPQLLGTNTFDAHRRYVALNETMYINSLDPAVNYTFTITGDEDPTKILGLVAWKACFLHNPEFVVRAGAGGSNASSTAAGGSDNAGISVVVSSGSSQPTSTGNSEAGAGASSAGTKTNIGAIAGGVVGGLLGAGLLAAVIFFLCRRRRQRHKASTEPFVIDVTEDAVTPFKPDTYRDGPNNQQHQMAYASLLPHNQHHDGRLSREYSPYAGREHGYSAGSATSGPSSQEYQVQAQEKHRQQTVTVNPDEPMNEETVQVLLNALQKHRQSSGLPLEEDAGPALDVRLMPPMYNPMWAPPAPQVETSAAGSSIPPNTSEYPSGTTSPTSRPKWH
ncbi:hypothetical protein CC85DRAFT_288387 [Cutaneotrichosporon oleaginosum]|uniref:receptor protein-tyrosine kinase n=1 Tax=Cutaneotrichosporon oleaginosum TaxID=879819 RepID=A0A0J0XEU8_9TREE|nr:uncharacterized protein CC85DRAFT_288387 [Cutaneotrichosporon oleaginosum]KLT39590.1 hypothetical protein CC85DRAFT_288387 [Cutaneotrichosporon oleaginosum]TXT15482.1 hypothetical protein COLE_01675 [Cutaneotrichosporon oleaginosum]